MVSSRHNP